MDIIHNIEDGIIRAIPQVDGIFKYLYDKYSYEVACMNGHNLVVEELVKYFIDNSIDVSLVKGLKLCKKYNNLDTFYTIITIKNLNIKPLISLIVNTNFKIVNYVWNNYKFDSSEIHNLFQMAIINSDIPLLDFLHQQGFIYNRTLLNTPIYYLFIDNKNNNVDLLRWLRNNNVLLDIKYDNVIMKCLSIAWDIESLNIMLDICLASININDISHYEILLSQVDHYFNNCPNNLLSEHVINQLKHICDNL